MARNPNTQGHISIESGEDFRNRMILEFLEYTTLPKSVFTSIIMDIETTEDHLLCP